MHMNCIPGALLHIQLPMRLCCYHCQFVQRGVAVGAALQDHGQQLADITKDLSSCRSEFFSEEQAAHGRYADRLT